MCWWATLEPGVGGRPPDEPLSCCRGDSRTSRDIPCMQGWFDDRVEARNALAKVAKLWQISGFDHAELPWMDVGEREGRIFNKQAA